jgi:hypothetical protein
MSRSYVRCRWRCIPTLPQELRQMVAHQFLKLRLAPVRPPQAFLREALLKIQYLAPLVRFRFGLGCRCPLVEVDHDLRATVLLPGGIGPQEFVFRA